MIVTTVVYCWVLLAAFGRIHDVLALPYAGGNHNQWPGGRGATGGYQQQQQRGWNQGGGGGGGGYNNNFGQGGGWGGRQQWQSGGNGQGAEAYRTNVFNEPDRYGYDYTIPGATVHYLMYKKQGNRGQGGNGNFGGGVDSSGWNRNRNHY